MTEPFKGVTFCITNENAYNGTCSIETGDPPRVVAFEATQQFAKWAVPILNQNAELLRRLGEAETERDKIRHMAALLWSDNVDALERLDELVEKAPTKKVCGYAFVMRMNGVPVICFVQARESTEAITKIMASGRERLDARFLHAATLIPGHRDDLFPNASEDNLETMPTVDDWEANHNTPVGQEEPK